MIGLWGSEMSYGCKHPASRGQCDLIWRNFCKFINYIVFGNFWTYMGKLLKNLCADDKDRGSDCAKTNNLKWRFKLFGLTHHPDSKLHMFLQVEQLLAGHEDSLGNVNYEEFVRTVMNG